MIGGLVGSAFYFLEDGLDAITAAARFVAVLEAEAFRPFLHLHELSTGNVASVTS